MNPQDICERVKEFTNIRENAGGDEAALLEAALFVEDVFEIRLSDEEICEENLGTHQAIEKFVSKKLEVSGPCAEFVE